MLLIVCFSLFGREVINGETTIFEFSKIPKDAKIRYDSTDIPLLPHPLHVDKKIAIVPVKYREKEGDKNLRVIYKNGSKQLSLHVRKGDYPFEEIKVSSSKVKPDKKQRERTSREYKEAMKIYHHFTPKSYINRAFIMPMDSLITSRFGTARLFNNSLKSFHSGTDFRAKKGTPVYATNDGVVVIAKNRYYAGNSVVIDHGYGIYSCYYHLSSLHVKVGERVKQHQLLGLSGATGRVSGPHLHYAMMIQGVQVNPLQFHRVFNALF
jgi:murein DD-endopeptidase MepM/ murein hydrolase activator NlpD